LQYDVNSDGCFDNQDVRAVSNTINSKIYLAKVDFNRDNVVNLKDLEYIRNVMWHRFSKHSNSPWTYYRITNDLLTNIQDVEFVASSVGKAYDAYADINFNGVVDNRDIAQIGIAIFDLSGDGKVNSTDQNLLTTIILSGGLCPNRPNTTYCDFNGDRFINVADVTAMTNYIQKYGSLLPGASTYTY